MPWYKVDWAFQHDIDKIYTLSKVLSIIYMGIYACKRLYICIYNPKFDPIVLNKCAQHSQLGTNYNLTGGIAFTMCSTNSKYGSYITATLYK